MTTPGPPLDADRDRRRAAVLAKVADPVLSQTPLQLPGVGTPLGLPPAPAIPGAGQVRTAAERRFERVGIPAGVSAGLCLVLFAIVGVAMLIGWSGTLPLVLLILFGVGFVGLGVVGVRAGALSRKSTTSIPAVVWQSSQPWLGPLATSQERRLVGIACTAVARIVGAPVWASPSMDNHRLTLDLPAELDQIDAQAYALASARYPTGGGSPVTSAIPAPGQPGVDPALYGRWLSLVDHVAALDGYANSVAALGSGTAQPVPGGAAVTAPTGRATPRLADAQDQRLTSGAVQDEFATAHLQQLTADLNQRPGPG